MFADVNGTRVYYELHGRDNAPTLALCHSLGTSTELWNAQVSPDAPFENFRILRYDFRGHGQSPAPSDTTSVEELAGDFIALLDHLEIERVDFAGVSLGGLIGQWLGARAPARIERLVLANTAAHIGTNDTWNQRIAIVREKGPARLVDGAIGRWFSPAFAAREPVTTNAFRRILLATSRDGYIGACTAIRDADHRDLVREIACPTLLVTGESDIVTTVDDAEWLARQIPGAKLVVLPAAHLANVEAAAEFNREVCSFLSSSEA